jgi:hypothetical protein
VQNGDVSFCGKKLNAKVASDCTTSSNTSKACCLANLSAGADFGLNACIAIPVKSTFILPYVKNFNYLGLNVNLQINCGNSFSPASTYRCSDPNTTPSDENQCDKQSKKNDRCCLFQGSNNQKVCFYESFLKQDMGGIDISQAEQAGFSIKCKGNLK